MMIDPSPKADPRNGAAVLIVDDEALVAVYLEDTLDALGIQSCGIAASANEAIALAQSRRPAVALVDIGLRGSTDGITLASELMQSFGTLVVFLSGSTDADTLQRAQAIRPFGILSKPCDETEIAHVLHSAIRRLPVRTRPTVDRRH